MKTFPELRALTNAVCSSLADICMTTQIPVQVGVLGLPVTVEDLVEIAVQNHTSAKNEDKACHLM